MYGTVARNRFKPGRREEFMKMVAEAGNRPADGVHLLVCVSDADPDEAWIAVAFSSKEAYEASSKSPEMNEMYERMMEYMAAPPEWHDGEVLAPWS